MRIHFTTLTALAFALACGVAQAQSPAFRCGGVGQAEQEQFKAEAANHQALLTFALSTGAYLSDVDFRIADSAGKVVLEGKCSGPLMLLDLPGQGSYQVTASSQGRSQSKTVTMGAKPTRVTFTWP